MISEHEFATSSHSLADPGRMDEKLKDVLTPEQLEKFNKYRETYQERARSSRQSFGGGRSRGEDGGRRRPRGEGVGGRSRGGDEEQ